MSIYQTYKPAGGGDGLFLKISDGDSVKLRIASEPAIFTTTFEGSDPSTRFAWTVWNRGEKKAQVFNGGKSIYNQIADLVEEWGEPTTFDISVKRTGQGLETRYSVNPLPKSTDLTKEEQEECDKVDLLKAVKGYWLKDFKDGGAPEPIRDEVHEVDDAPMTKEDLNSIFPD